MFFLTNGILETIKNRGLLQGQSFNYTDTSTNATKVMLRNYEKPAIVKVENIKSIRENSLILLNLCDGKTKLEVKLEKNHWSNLSDFKEIFGIERTELIADEKLIKKGSVIIISEYTFQDTFISEKEKVDEMLILLNYSVLGFENIDEKSKNEVISTKNTLYMIKDLTTSLKNMNWYITVKLLKKSIVKEFVNKLNGSNGKFVRTQFTDESGIIEVVAFNDEIDKVNELCEDKIYEVSNADIKNSNASYQAFDESNISKCELIVNKKTKFIEVNNGENCFKIFRPKKQDDKVFFLKKDDKYKHLSSINELRLKKEGETVNVIAVIVKIDDLQEVTPKFKSPINLRNIHITDQSNERIKVALWGKQASEFNLKTGELCIFSKIKVKNYQGLFLQVEWESMFSKVEEQWDDELSSALRKWWKEKNEEDISSSLKRSITINDLSNSSEKKIKE
jgi:hypothetical protein